MLSSPTKKCITDITMIRPNLKKKDWKDELMYNCIFCSEQIMYGIEAYSVINVVIGVIN